MEYVKNTMNLAEKQALEVARMETEALKRRRTSPLWLWPKRAISTIPQPWKTSTCLRPGRAASLISRATCALMVKASSGSSIAACRRTRRRTIGRRLLLRLSGRRPPIRRKSGPHGLSLSALMTLTKRAQSAAITASIGCPTWIITCGSPEPMAGRRQRTNVRTRR